MCPEIMKIDLEDIWIKQVGATPNFANDTIGFLTTKFSARVMIIIIDSTSLDYFLQGNVKCQVCKNYSQSTFELKEVIPVVRDRVSNM